MSCKLPYDVIFDDHKIDLIVELSSTDDSKIIGGDTVRMFSKEALANLYALREILSLVLGRPVQIVYMDDPVKNYITATIVVTDNPKEENPEPENPETPGEGGTESPEEPDTDEGEGNTYVESF